MTVYLHIGMPKTGTSALQMFLPQNNEILHAKGIDYPLMPFRFRNVGPRRNAHFLALWQERETAPEWKQGFEEVKASLDRWEKVILSDENLWTRQRDEGFWDVILENFSKLGAKVQVIVYLRSQDDQVESNWNQKVKDPKTRITLSFEEYMAQELYSYMPFQYGEALDSIAANVGRENLTVRVYEKRQFVGGNLFADFLDVLGLVYSEEYGLPSFTANVRLPNSAVEIKRMINFAYRDVEVPDFYRDIISQVFGIKLITEPPEHHTSMFPPDLRASFMEQYKETNAYVAREYLGRSDGVLFSGDNASLPQWEMDDHQILMDMIKIFAAEGVTLYKRQQELEEKNKKLEERLTKIDREQTGALPVLTKRVTELYNSLPFRIYRKIRNKKDGTPEGDS